MLSFKLYIENKSHLKPNELKRGDKIEDINSDCKHYKSKGTVTRVTKIKGKNGNIVGNKVAYKCTNKGKNWDKNEELEKTEIQLSKSK
jgi:hypothetical protein